MGITDKVGQLATNVQEGVKTSSVSLFTILLKIVTAAIVGLTFALIGQSLMGFGNLSFVFMFLVVTAIIFKLISKLQLVGVLIFDLICVLVGLLLRMYILIAP